MCERQQSPAVQARRSETVLTSANRRSNAPWGDVLQEKPSHVTRIYSQNVNGLTFDRRGGQFEEVCRVHKEVQADIFVGQEHNLDTTQYHVRSSLYDAAKQHCERARLIFGTTPIPFHSTYKPGGTFILSSGNFSGRMAKQVQDPWGRWVLQEFAGRQGRLLVVVSAYQPVDKRGDQGVLTVASQQASLLRLSKDSVTNPRSAFRRDLLKAMRPYKSAGAEILLIGDFNEPFGSDPAGMSGIASHLSLTNLMAVRHSASPPATYARGSKCLDYALASKTVCDALLRAGYEPFDARLSSDHRGYFFDFHTDTLLGNLTQDLATPQQRMLSASNVNQVTKYINEKYDLLLAHNAFVRAERLSYLGNRHQFAERLDRVVLESSLVAESRIPQFGAPAWSVKLAQARQLVQWLRKVLSTLRTRIDHTNILANDRPAEFDGPVPSTVKECSRQLRVAKQTVCNIVQQSYTHRDQERAERIRDLEISASSGDRHLARILRRLKKAEDIKLLFNKLQCARQGNQKKGVVRIEIPLHPEDDPKSCTQWTQVDIPTEVVRHLQDRNRAHFGQAHGTPFTVPPLSDHLGFTGSGPAQDQMLKGEFDVSPYAPNVRLLLSHLRHTQEMAEDNARPTISEREFVGKLRVWSESTTTSPSRMHLGHYKALIARHAYTTTAPDEELTQEFRDKRDELNRRQQALLQLHLSLLNYALERGYSYTRWQTIANTILFKDKDNFRLHRTRVIHIYEADFNLALGVKWRAAMRQAEDLRLLNEGQYGSRSYRNAIDPVFIEELQLEVSQGNEETGNIYKL
ncbi:hypothetical protein MHU86_22426 [Fragilaria crotonensis]|nr:hypothetical protein MHU86_22426 [Fragilaria crotonensis]